MTLLAGCAHVPDAGNMTARLSDPPLAAVEALGEAAQRNPDVAAWIVHLERFYRKQDALDGK